MSENKVQFITLNNSIVLSFNKKSATVVKGTAEYAEVCAALADGRFDDIPGIVDKEVEIKKTLVGSEFEVVEGHVFCEGEPVDSYVSGRLIEFFNSGLPYQPLLNFWKRLRNNPSENSVKQLYKFLEVAECPLLEDGRFLSLKGVVSVPNKPNTFCSKHDHRFEYVLNVPATMPRESVVDDPDTACGPGLHAGSYNYARDWASGGGIMLELVIDPEHVVSVPIDCDCQKLRACQVLPVAVHTGGKFKKGVVLEDVPEVDAVEVTTNSEDRSAPITGAPVSPYVIHKAGYVVYEINENQYDNITATGADVVITVRGLMRYRASKAPAAIRRHAAAHPEHTLTEAYTFKLPKYSELSLFASKCAATSDEAELLGDKYYLFIHELLGGAAVHQAIQTYCENRKSSVVVRDVFNLKYPSLWLVTYCKEQYEVVDVGTITIDAFIADNSEGVVKSATQIKPSKAPVGLKDAVGNKVISRIVRVTLANDAVAFLVSCEGRTFLMRKE